MQTPVRSANSKIVYWSYWSDWSYTHHGLKAKLSLPIISVLQSSSCSFHTHSFDKLFAPELRSDLLMSSSFSCFIFWASYSAHWSSSPQPPASVKMYRRSEFTSGGHCEWSIPPAHTIAACPLSKKIFTKVQIFQARHQHIQAREPWQLRDHLNKSILGEASLVDWVSHIRYPNGVFAVASVSWVAELPPE